MTPKIHDRKPVQPFAHDAEYLEAEVEWVKARCRYLGARITADQEADDEPMGIADADDRQHGASDETRRKVALFETAEATLRDTIDARLDATRDAGITLGLDRVCDHNRLDDLERQVLLLATVPALGLELAEVLGNVGTFGFAIMSVTPELIAVFCGLDLAGRLGLRYHFGPTGKLVTGGLIDVDIPCGERVQDFPVASLFVTEKAFNQIVGLASTDDEICPSCGQPVGGEGGL